jgi:outer membrane protein OmpA-like peptidoglycan-associated protein
MMNYGVVFICCCSLFFLISCAPKKNLIVLLADPDGQVGKIVVSNKAGSQLLTEPRHATEVKFADVSPTSPFLVKEEEVFKIFGEALSAQPEPPLRFLLYFQSGTVELTAESQRKISKILAAIEARKSKDISIVGHTDRVGSREANYQLGLERVDSIKAILVDKGVDPSGIEVASHGEDNPLVETEDEVEEPRNRRIEITVR